MRVVGFMVSPMKLRHDRSLYFDFLHPLTQTPYAMLIPAPQVYATNIEAVWKPFQPNANSLQKKLPFPS